MRRFWADLEKRTNLPVLKSKQVSRAHGEMPRLSLAAPVLSEGWQVWPPWITCDNRQVLAICRGPRTPSPGDTALVSGFVSLVSGARETHLPSTQGRGKGKVNLRKVRVAGQALCRLS